MRKLLSKSAAGILMGTFVTNLASAHPGHALTDVVAEVSQPAAGADHFVAFVALAATLLFALRLAFNARRVKCVEKEIAHRSDDESRC